ncbi:hypothetical protein HUJ05_007567 [Dendroctonus ponderosae]|nr:hypothetical protein HUJ05_007567 [Dendroctonus ponderosae]
MGCFGDRDAGHANEDIRSQKRISDQINRQLAKEKQFTAILEKPSQIGRSLSAQIDQDQLTWITSVSLTPSVGVSRVSPD